ncbi:hypothetical protein TTHERM_00575540 (macronuclear) [Tetrahymena thermophila SB210]|uniref:Uncharacterized protein n=1 Tax=Tetrahymena thermophila (strain SB210) TaxID=312017 RepID=Q22V46_TETTS|nr:hypothetical protein TTHERM_00575540 [Tetrahymena thermophila SB210]EAR89102.2 hypothetical protein TTHERM_00575540 [Tetrahymena thermophila SB210]|eukprot:XP_001009347.2 hypothetical protein TTHERM_00575540 [Tetrahymena thermophila SB210]
MQRQFIFFIQLIKFYKFMLFEVKLFIVFKFRLAEQILNSDITFNKIKLVKNMGEKQSKNKSIKNFNDNKKNPQKQNEDQSQHKQKPKEETLDIILINDSQAQQKITLKSYSEIENIDSTYTVSLIIDQPKQYNIISFPDQNMIQLCKLIEKSKKLINLRLNLYGWRIEDSGFIKLVDTFSFLQNITQLELNYQYNSAYEIGTSGLAQALSKCYNIQYLNLAISQSIDDETLIKLGQALSQLFKLKILILDFGEHPTIDVVIYQGEQITQIYDEGFKRFFQCLKKCQDINYIQLYFDFMVDFNIKMQQKIMLKFKKLTYFNIAPFEDNRYFKRSLQS